MRAVRALSVAVACWSVALPAAAFTISLTVSGTTYDVLFTQGSYNAVNGNPAPAAGLLTTTPWWGDSGLATSLATALQTADSVGGGGPVVPNASGYYNFTYAFSGASTNSSIYAGPSTFFNAPSVTVLYAFQTSASIAGDPLYYASVAPAAVPEIDGGALAKALFILFALGAWLRARRAAALPTVEH